MFRYVGDFVLVCVGFVDLDDLVVGGGDEVEEVVLFLDFDILCLEVLGGEEGLVLVDCGLSEAVVF